MGSLRFDGNLIAVNSSKRTRRVPQLFAVLLQTSRTIAVGVLLVGMSQADVSGARPSRRFTSRPTL
jgi:hypothetical protein